MYVHERSTSSLWYPDPSYDVSVDLENLGSSRDVGPFGLVSSFVLPGRRLCRNPREMLWNAGLISCVIVQNRAIMLGDAGNH